MNNLFVLIGEELALELEKSYEKEFANSLELDSKATSMITMSGTIATLFMGFGTFFLRDIPSDKLEILLPAASMLVIEIILITLTIIYSVKAYRIKGKPYFSSMTLKQFLDNDGNVNKKLLENYVSKTKDAFFKDMIDDYLIGTFENSRINEEKRNKIVRSQLLFNIALIVLPLFAFLIVLYKFL